MKPITQATTEGDYFWIGEGTPTITTNVPAGASYTDQTTGNSWRFISGVWVDVVDINAAALPKVYRALLTQASTTAPVATVLQNDFTGAIVWTRSSRGMFIGTLAGVFTANKTFLRCDMNNNAVAGAVTQGFSFVRTSANVVSLTTFDGVTQEDDALMTAVPVEILVYP